MRTVSRVLLLVLLVPTFAFAEHRFHAGATVLGGEGRPSVGALALSPAGGEAKTNVDAYDDGLVRFANARVTVRGAHENGMAVTTSETIINDVAIGGRLHADRLVVRITGRHAPDAAEAELSFEGSSIENLTIDGVPVDATLDASWFTARPTFAALREEGMEFRFGTISCSAHKQAVCGPGRRDLGIEIPGLGVLFIGEVNVRDGWRQLNLLRLERPAAGGRPSRLRANGRSGGSSIVVGTNDSNGSPSWP